MAIGPVIILESCRWIASGLKKFLATSSNAAGVQHADGGGLMFVPTTASRQNNLRVSAG